MTRINLFYSIPGRPPGATPRSSKALRALAALVICFQGAGALWSGEEVVGSKAEALPGANGCELFVEGEEEAAYDALEKTLLETADGVEECVYLFKGLVERNRGELPQAITSFQSGLELYTKSEPMRLELAVTHSWNEQLPEALAEYRSLLEFNPNLLPARIGEARILGWQQRLKDSDQAYRKVLEEHPENLEARNGLAFNNRARMLERRARVQYQEVLDLEPTNVEALEGLAALKKVKNFRLVVSQGEQETAGLQGESVFSATLSHQVKQKTSWFVGYEEGATEFIDPLLTGTNQEGSFQTNYKAGFSFPLGKHDGLTVTAQQRQLKGTSGEDRFLGVDYNRTMTEDLFLLAGARGGDLVVGGDQYLAHLGLVWLPIAGHQLVGQVYYNTDLKDDSGHALAARWVGEFFGLLRVQAGYAWGDDRGTTFHSESVEVSFLLFDRFEVFALGQQYSGSFDRDSFNGGLRLQF